uniref:LigA n=1 Tax=Parastrongyloides trichosuri TaxID=131310 RepID=A0A0N4ZIW9_PARTI
MLSAQATDAGVNKATRALGADPADLVDRPVSHQGEERHRRRADAGRAARRRGPAEPYRPAGSAGRGAQDRQRGAERTGDRAGHRGGHPRLPRLAPAGAGQCGDAGQGGGPAAPGGARGLAAQGAPLADPARPLYLPGAAAEMPGLRDLGPVPLTRQLHGGARRPGRSPARSVRPPSAPSRRRRPSSCRCGRRAGLRRWRPGCVRPDRARLGARPSAPGIGRRTGSGCGTRPPRRGACSRRGSARRRNRAGRSRPRSRWP